MLCDTVSEQLDTTTEGFQANSNNSTIQLLMYETTIASFHPPRMKIGFLFLRLRFSKHKSSLPNLLCFPDFRIGEDIEFL